METTDKQLVEEFLNGNDLAFERLLKKHLKPLYNFLYQLTGDSLVAEDLTQITFVKSWKNLRRYDNSKNFKVWIFAIAKNTAYDWFKKKKTIPFSSFIDGEGNNKLENISDKNILPDEILNRKNIAEELENKLQELPEHYRLVLTLHYKEGFSLSEISEILKISCNTAKSQHLRGLMKLKKLLEK